LKPARGTCRCLRNGPRSSTSTTSSPRALPYRVQAAGRVYPERAHGAGCQLGLALAAGPASESQGCPAGAGLENPVRQECRVLRLGRACPDSVLSAGHLAGAAGAVYRPGLASLEYQAVVESVSADGLEFQAIAARVVYPGPAHGAECLGSAPTTVRAVKAGSPVLAIAGFLAGAGRQPGQV